MGYHKVVLGINDLKTMCLKNDKAFLLEEWDYSKNTNLDMDSLSYGSEKKVWWRCSAGHEWQARICTRTKMNTRCPYCCGREVISGINDLQTRFPNIASEWHPTKNGYLKPTEIMGASNKRVWWLCPEGHSYEAKIGNRTNLNRGCPYCSGVKTLEGYNDLKTWCVSNGKTDLLEEWNYDKNDIAPTEISPKNNKKVWWKCSLGHEWEASIGSRTSDRPSGCPYCSNPPKRILVGFNDFESWCVNNGKDYLLKEWDSERNTELSPKEISYGSGRRVWWKCNKGHEWKVSPGNRVQGTNCPVCARTQTSFPEQAIAYYLSKSFKILQRYRIKGFELDIYLEDYNIGIEYDGIYFHTKDNFKRENDKNSFFKERKLRLVHVKETDEKKGIEDDTIFYVPRKSNYLDDSFNDMLSSLCIYLEGITGVEIKKDINIVRDEFAIREQYTSIIKNSSVAAVLPELVVEWDIKKIKE